RFGRFTLKSGRESPYFFDAARFDDGAALAILGRCYADALQAAGIDYDLLFGPAYKGIPLVAVTAAALTEHHGRNVPWAFNRKEIKDHGEGGRIVGRALAGRVVIVDDVLTAGTAVRDAIALIRAAGATPVAVLLALDRQERGHGARSAVQELEADFGLRCVSIVTLSDLIALYSARDSDRLRISEEALARLRAYRERYGVDSPA
ncbi:MAG: orotate phosphoribosyltransferase, partial [Steroidobacteraceae bacterium]|nr:orotate phosphoribosyltransferase [Steroidobacteraceae bacterium]